MLDDMIKPSKEDRLIIDEPGIKGWVRDSTPFSNTVPMVKIRYSFREDIDPGVFMELLTSKRKLWDKELTSYEDMASDDDWTIYRYSMPPPASLCCSMYSVEKRLLFEEEGAFYGYYSSVPDNVLPLGKNYSRCHTVFGGTVLKKERGEYAYYSLSQMDLHVNSWVQHVIMKFVPGKTKEFYKRFKEVIYDL